MGGLFPVNDYYEQLEIDEKIRKLRGEERRRIFEVFDEYIFNSIANSNFTATTSLCVLKTDYVEYESEVNLLMRKAKIFASMSKDKSSNYAQFVGLKAEINEIKKSIDKKITTLLGEDEEDILEEDFSEDYDESDEEDFDEEAEEDLIEEEKPKTILKRFL